MTDLSNEREAFLTEYILQEGWKPTDVNDPALRGIVGDSLGFQLAWLPRAAAPLGHGVQARVERLREKVAARRDEALRRYWRS